MSVLFAALVLVSLLALTVAAPSASWKHAQRVDDLTAPIHLTIGLKQRRVADLERIATAVSTPRSATYRQHLSLADIDELIAPSAESIEAVRTWLQQSGVPLSELAWSRNGEWLNVDTTVAGAERLLSAEYHLYKHVSGATVMRCQSYSLPASVRAHIDVVGPTTRFPALRSPLKTSLPSLHSRTGKRQVDSPCDSGTTPDCIRAVYQVGNASASSNLSTAAVTAFLEQYILQSDLDTFLQQYEPARAGFVPQLIGANYSQPGVESSLDIQYITALTPGVNNITFWYTAGRQPSNPDNEPFLLWLSALANTTSPPLVISTSYGDDEPTVDYDYAVRVSTEFMKAGARGISLLFASGDSGVGDATSGPFLPTFPADSPWITAVGGTKLADLPSLNETAARFSSGGFSNFFPMPDYQTAAVSDYLTTYGTNIPDPKLWNATGRAFPDVSALAVGFPIIVAGQPVRQPLSHTCTAATSLLCLFPYALCTTVPHSSQHCRLGHSPTPLLVIALCACAVIGWRNELFVSHLRCSANAAERCGDGAGRATTRLHQPARVRVWTDRIQRCDAGQQPGLRLGGLLRRHILGTSTHSRIQHTSSD